MRYTRTIVMGLAAFAAAFCPALPAPAGDADAPRLHMVYFYNPSCRLCTATNVAVGNAEEKYKDQLTSERFNIADPQHGLDYMDNLFTILDELGVPDDVSTLLTVVLGEIVVENGQERFIPKEILMEEDDIAGNVDRVIGEFILNAGKGGNTLGQTGPADFFFRQRPSLDPAGRS